MRAYRRLRITNANVHVCEKSKNHDFRKLLLGSYYMPEQSLVEKV
jgi:hypothetical protein